MTTRRRAGRTGFTMMELVVVAALMSLLVVVLANVWKGFVKPALYAEQVCRVALEARMAREALARDFSGSAPEKVPNPSDNPSGAYDYRLLDVTPGSDGHELALAYNNCIHVNYSVIQDGPNTPRLVRQYTEFPGCATDGAAVTTSFVVAHYVTGFQVHWLPPQVPGPDAPGLVEILMTFQLGDVPERQYRLVGVIAP